MNEMIGLEKQKSQSGQALVEYVLLIAIGTTLLLGLAAQFYKPFGGWVQNQMGPYLECLLDVGELPSLGGEGSGECATQFKPFTPGAKLASGNAKPLNSNGDGPGNATARNSSLESSGRGGSTAPGGGSSAPRSSGVALGGARGADGAGAANGEQVIIEKLPESQFLKLKSSASGSVVVQKNLSTSAASTVISTGKTGKNSKGEAESVKVGTIDESETPGAKNKKIVMKPPERKSASTEEEEAFSFGQYLKFAVILMIIIAIILFLAGQIAQISKSMEK